MCVCEREGAGCGKQQKNPAVHRGVGALLQMRNCEPGLTARMGIRDHQGGSCVECLVVDCSVIIVIFSRTGSSVWRVGGVVICSNARSIMYCIARRSPSYQYPKYVYRVS